MNIKVVSLAVLVGAGVSGLGYYFLKSDVPSSDEFFKRNPHLTRFSEKFKQQDKVRTSDEYLEGDFKLINGFTYPISFKHEMKMANAEKELLDMSFEGNLEINSLGIKDRKIVIVVDYNLGKVSDQIKLSDEGRAQVGMGSAFKNNQIMAKLDPAGRVVEMWATDEKFDEQAMELKVLALNMLFRKIPSLNKGSFSITEADDKGVTYPMSYTISEEGKDLQKIVGRVNLDHKLGANPQKAAAAGAPAMSLISLTSERDQGFIWLWNSSLSIPTKQDMSSVLQLKYEDRVVSASSSKASTVWSAPVKTDKKLADIDSFKVKIDFKNLLGRIGSKINYGDSALSFNRTYKELLKELQEIDSESMGDSEKEKFFVELAHAVKEDPSLISTLTQEALNSASGSRKVSMILGALGYEGSPLAQEGMVEIYKRTDATSEEKEKVLTEFTLAPLPLTGATKDFLKSIYKSQDPLSSDISGIAGLAIGSSLSKDGDPQTVKFVLNEWENTDKVFIKEEQKDSKIEYLLTVMGNSKSDAFLPQIQRSISSSNPEIRSAAVNAVRFAQDEESREILFKSLSDDENLDVKLTAAQSLMYQPFDEKTFNALQSCSEAGSGSLKIQCYRVLSNRIEQPGVRDYLTTQASKENDVQVASMIKEALTLEEAKE